ncbi:hypothetical protein ABZ743_24560 [Streptomyces sp. NPDC006662]|uniref:hypothetical protein n=1 Tax=Streptomyces sp. NPDC006662 TaxID=3156902 RepID=UPI0033F36F14
MDFPEFADPAPLTAFEVEALRALHITLQDLRHEHESALALSHRYFRAEGIARLYTQGRALTHHPDALNQLGHLAGDYERGVGLLTWRYASAAAVFGTTLLERLVAGRAALTAATVTTLCEEPTLGHLRDSLSIPSTALLVAQEGEDQKSHDAERLELLRAVEGAVECAAELGDGVPQDAAALWDGRLTDWDRPDRDPLYEWGLGKIVRYAHQMPHEIGRYLKYARSRALPPQPRT